MSFSVYRDDWGIPHLRADSANELAYAQGVNVAFDRAWQIEVERHRAAGTSAAFLGASALPWDRFARQARLEDTARRCFTHLHAETQAWLAAYVDGVNAGLADGTARAPEFAAVGLAPGRFQAWTPIAIWLSTHILFAGFPTKLWREEVAQRLGERAIALFATDGHASAGSNGWLVAGDRSASGGAILAGDPHRILEDPGVYQQVQLACPAYDVVGLAVPGVPGVAHFGHAGEVAWAITNAMADYQDLYWERLRRDGARVLVQDPEGWAAATVHVERIDVAGERPVEVEVIETARGPVIAGGPDASFAISLRHPPRVAAEIGFDALPRLLRARRVEDVDRALDGWVEPVNVVLAADREGGLLHRVAGRVPQRDARNRLRVVPGWDAAHAWGEGWEPLPRRAVDDLAVMANERGLAATLGVEFAPPHRAARIEQLLAAAPTWAPREMARVHMDTVLGSAEPLLDLLRSLQTVSPEAARMRARLVAWDRRMDAESLEAACFAALRGDIVRRVCAHPALAPLAALAALPYPELFTPWLDLTSRVGFALEGLLARDVVPGLDRTALVSDALEALAREGAPTTSWGARHRLAPWQALPGVMHERWPGLSGDHDCVLSTCSIPAVSDLCARGPAARYVWDLAHRDDSLWVVPLGAAGVPGDPHQRDQLPGWLGGELLPVVSDFARLRCERAPSEAARCARVRTAVYEGVRAELGTLRVLPVVPTLDLDVLDAWVHEERARFWGMREHSREHVREIYTYLDGLSTHHAYLVHRGTQPVALFQTYEPAADPVGGCYPVRPGDCGIHLLIGPAASGRVPGFTGALLDLFLSFVFASPTVQRVIAEPDARNARAIARLVRAGFVLGPEIALPEKRARLAFLPRGARADR